MSSDTTNTMIDYGNFAARLAAQTDRWSLLKEVLDEWGISVHRETEPEFTEEAIAIAEERLGFPLPSVLKEWYALPFRVHEQWPKYGTCVVPPSSEYDGLGLFIQDGLVGFHHEGCDCCKWGFRVTDAAMQDPPIYNGMELMSDVRNFDTTWVLQNRRLSEWALHRTIADAVLDGPLAAVVEEVSRDEAAILLSDFRRMGFPVEPWFQTELLGGLNAVIRTSPAYDRLAWDRVKSAGPHPTILLRETWDFYWEPATAGPLSLLLCCRDENTLEQFLSRSRMSWKLLNH